VQWQVVLQCCVAYCFLGPEKGGYYHQLFLRGNQHLAQGMERITRSKRIGFRERTTQEPRPHPSTVPFLPMARNTAGQLLHALVQQTRNQFEAIHPFAPAGDR